MGLDLSDSYSSPCLIDAEGAILEEGRIRTSTPALARRVSAMAPCRVVLEVGIHSPWVSRLAAEAGHEVIVANPRAVRLIAESDRKQDRTDAEQLARLGRLDPHLLAPIRHRGQQAQEDLTFLRSRHSLVRARTALINHVRSVVKVHGGRLPACSAPAFHRKVVQAIPPGLRPALLPHLEFIAQFTRQIAAADQQVEALCIERYPGVLRQVPGVGPLTALTYVLGGGTMPLSLMPRRGECAECLSRTASSFFRRQRPRPEDSSVHRAGASPRRVRMEAGQNDGHPTGTWPPRWP